MQRKKNIRLLISLAGIISLTILLFVFTNTKSGSSVNKALFQIENLDKVDQVILESPRGKTELKFDGTKWLVNDHYEADNQMITVLFATLKQTIAKRPVAANQQDSLQKEITKNGVKVSYFETGILAKEFWVDGNSQKTETYFQGKDGKPYVVAIPGYRVFVASVFELPTNDWRNKQVFNFNWQNIKSLDVTFPSDAKQNFKASFSGKYFSIEGINTDTTKLDLFMDALFQLRAEKILDTQQAKSYDSLVKQKPIMKIVIQDIAQRNYPLTIFPIDKGKLVATNQNELILLNLNDLTSIFRKRDYFIGK